MSRQGMSRGMQIEAIYYSTRTNNYDVAHHGTATQRYRSLEMDAKNRAAAETGMSNAQ